MVLALEAYIILVDGSSTPKLSTSVSHDTAFQRQT